MTLRRRLIFSLVATLLALGGAEVVLRAAGAVVSARHRERTQSLAGEGELRIWALGDSYTFGIGADDPARDTWPVVVARRLEEATGRSAGVLNLATPGANSSEIVDVFEQRLGDTDPPDVVLLLAALPLLCPTLAMPDKTGKTSQECQFQQNSLPIYLQQQEPAG